MRFSGLIACIVLLSSCASHSAPGNEPTSSMGPASAAASYTPRLGVAVTTSSRTCFAIQNANLAVGAPVTLVSPMSPQTFVQAEISATSSTPCPISKEVDPTVTNYDLQVSKAASLPKLTPLIAVVGPSAPFSVGPNNSLTANLDQNNKTQSFRSCAASDGIHLTVWSGNPLDGTLLWHGYYYEPGNPGAGPACTPKEMTPPS